MLTQESTSWEHQLLVLAHEGLESYRISEPVAVNQTILRQSYRYCEELTYTHSRTFYLASQLLPGPKRQAMRALYAFCRVSDDLIDRSGIDPDKHLNEWRRRALSSRPSQDNPIALAWADTRMRYQIPERYAEQLIEGVARDIHQSRYQNFAELSAYCYGVASTVGLMAMHIIGFGGHEAIPYALKLGVALQLTNILRDVGEDWQQGRLYLPLDELAEFELNETDIQNSNLDARWQAFLSFQIERTRQLYAEAMPGIGLLDPDGRFAVRAAAELYQAILSDIQAHHGDVFSRRAHIDKWGKIKRLPGIWYRTLR